MPHSARGPWQPEWDQKRSRENKNVPSLRPVKLQKRKERTNEQESIEQEGTFSLWKSNYKLSKRQLKIGESNVNKVSWVNKRSYPEVSARAQMVHMKTWMGVSVKEVRVGCVQSASNCFVWWEWYADWMRVLWGPLLYEIFLHVCRILPINAKTRLYMEMLRLQKEFRHYCKAVAK